MVVKLDALGVSKPTILLPKAGTDLTKWTVIACDQYTQEPEYWKRVADTVGEAPSTLNLIFPEVYLEQGRDEEFINKINMSMKKYEDAGILESYHGFLVIDRSTPTIKSRKGLILALDLENYDFSKGSQTLIRATEATIASRLPPRIAVREKANVELPHILVLIDDPKKTVIEPLFEKKLDLAYDFELMENGGHIKGWKVDGDEIIDEIANALAPLADEEEFARKYPKKPEGSKPLLFAMGDGNHSFATAKSCWDKLKKEGASMDHPARYALVELQNIHDEGNEFEPIHRLLFNANGEEVLRSFEKHVTAKGMTYTFKDGCDKEQIQERSLKSPRLEEKVAESKIIHSIEFLSGKTKGTIEISNSPFVIAAATLTDFLDQYLEKNLATKIDYIHGTSAIHKEVASADSKSCGFILPTLAKSELFETVVCDGVLPRKTFSMGHADDKRFYLEARRIVQ